MPRCELEPEGRDKLAERGGFEPPVEVYPLRRFSKPLPSATRPPLRVEKTGRAESSRRGARACPAGETGLGARRAGYSGGAGGHRAGGDPGAADGRGRPSLRGSGGGETAARLTCD